MGVPIEYAKDLVKVITGQSPAVTVYSALLKNAPGPDVTMATLPEVTDSGYARQVVAWSVPAAPADPSQGGVESNSTALVSVGPFPAGMAAPATHVALVEAATGTSGKVRYVWALDQIAQADVGESVQFLAGNFYVAMDDEPST